MTADRLTFELPEPPTINVMLRLYSQFRRRGGKRVPLYQLRRREFEIMCDCAARDQGIRPPAEPWPEWRLDRAVFRVWSPKDPVELLASLKWTVDFLVRGGYVAEDSPRELTYLPPYYGLFDPNCGIEPVDGIWQLVDRSNRGVRLTIARG